MQGGRQFFNERIQLVGIAYELGERWFEIGNIDFEYFGQIVAYPGPSEFFREGKLVGFFYGRGEAVENYSELFLDFGFLANSFQ